MKIMILLDLLIFEDKDNEVVKEHIKEHGLNHFIHKNKLHVKGTKQDLFFMLYDLSHEFDIELM